LAFWPFFGPISSLLALQSLFDFWFFFGLFTLKWIPMKENYYSIFSAAQLQNFCDKCYIRPTLAF